MDLNDDGQNDILSGSYSRKDKSMAGLFQVLWGSEDGFKKATALHGSDGAPLIIPADDKKEIRKIEAGEFDLSSRLAAQVTALTGVDTRPMLKGRLSKPKTIDGRDFSLETFRRWKESKFDDEDIEVLVQALTGRISDILDRHSNSTSGLRHAYCLLSEALGTVTRSMAPLPDDTFLPEIEELHDVIDPGNPASHALGWGQVRRMASKPAPPKKKSADRKKAARKR